MGTIAGGAGAKTPRRLWIIGALCALWSLGNCWQFALISMREAETMTRFPPDVIDFMDAYPAWVIVAWGIEVSFALLGALLLLGRSRWAPFAYTLSLVGRTSSTNWRRGCRLVGTPGCSGR
jgi:hypothetical protein